MPKYISNYPYYIDDEPTEQRLREVLSEYNTNIHNFYTKKSQRAGRRARNNLLELYRICRERRKEILAGMKELGYWEHPSWNGIDEEDE